MKKKSQYSTISHWDDLDGYLSMLSAFHYKGQANIGGLSFDNCEIWVCSTPTETTVWLDLGVMREEYKTIDHHLTYRRNELSNPHYSKEIGLYNGDIKTKCPLNNVLYMLWKCRIELEGFNSDQLKLLLSADGVYNNFKKYNENTKNWLKKMDMEFLIRFLETTPKCEFEKVHRKKDFKINYLERENVLVDEHGIPAQDRLDELVDIMGWERLTLPEINYIYELETSFMGWKNYWNENTLTHAKLRSDCEVRSDIIGFRKLVG